MTNQIRFIIASLAVLALFSGSLHAQGKKYALVIGVEKYDPSQLASLDYAEEDAIAIGKALQAVGFDVVVMTSQSAIPERQPVLAQDILKQLERRLRNRDSSDTIFVSMSGHGVQLKSDLPAADGSKETYFCPQRASLADTSSLLPLSKVLAQISICQATKKILLVDACRNEVEPKDVKNKSVEIELDPAGVIRRTIPQGMVALFSCSPTERSYELASLGGGHSAFSYHVIQYLEGRADSVRYPRRELSVSEFATYVSRETRDYIDLKLNKDQTPELLLLDRSKLSDWSLGRLGGNENPLRSKSTGMEFILIQPGEFQMGSPQSELGYGDEHFENEAQHLVRITRRFRLGKDEVTQAQFEKVMGFNPSYFTDGDRTKLPVEQVTWFDAVMFCNRLSELDGKSPVFDIGDVEYDGQSIKAAKVTPVTGTGYRLPTEAEWEYSCRAGTTTAFSFGRNVTTDQANYDGNYPYLGAAKGIFREKTANIDLFPANPWGLRNMHGNVWEWCWDLYGDYPRGPVSDPSGLSTGSNRVRRGGSWRRDAAVVRSAYRLRTSPDRREDSFGFRVASSSVQ